MKPNRILIVSFLLLTVLVGCVSAAEDVQIDDTASTDEVGSIEATSVDDVSTDADDVLTNVVSDDSSVDDVSTDADDVLTNVVSDDSSVDEDVDEAALGSIDEDLDEASIRSVDEDSEIIANTENEVLGAPDVNLTIPSTLYVESDGCVYGYFGIDEVGKLTLFIDDKKYSEISIAYRENDYSDDSFYRSIYVGDLKPGKTYAAKLQYSGKTGTKTVTGSFFLDYNLDLRFNDPYFSGNMVTYAQASTITIDLPSNATGTVSVFIDDAKKADIVLKNGEGTYQLLSDLSITDHTIRVKYSGDSWYPEKDSGTQTFQVEPWIILPRNGDQIKDLKAILTLPPEADGNLTVYDYETKIKSEKLVNGKVVIDLSDLKLGKHSLWATYEKGTDHYLVEEAYRRIVDVTPMISVPSTFKYNVAKNATFELKSDASGTLSVKIDGKSVATTFANGKAVIPLKNLIPGEHIISFNYTGDSKYGTYDGFEYFTVTGVKPKITGKAVTMYYTDGSTFKVTVYGNTSKVAKGVKVIFKVNGKKYKTVKTNSKGVATLKLTLVPKTYKITATALGASLTKKVVVKKVLTLKAVKIKKSAKKLVLTAKLRKVKGKYLKGKLITFKFNGKKYKAKTNKKGVAKVTIKKAVLKKLKVGKKIKYQATYVKSTVKRTAKVKK